MNRSRWFAVCLLAAVSGCAARWTVFGHVMDAPAPDRPVKVTATEHGDAPKAPNTVAAAVEPVPTATSGAWKVGKVEVSLTASSRARLASDRRFNAAELSAAVRAQLQAHHLLDVASPASADRLAVVIESVAARPTTNAVVFGYHLSTGAIVGEVTLWSSDNQALRSSRVEARVSLARSQGTAEEGFFQPLYQRFAETTYRKLAGAAEPVAGNH